MTSFTMVTNSDKKDLGYLFKEIKKSNYSKYFENLDEKEVSKFNSSINKDIYLIGRVNNKPMAYAVIKGARKELPSLAVYILPSAEEKFGEAFMGYAHVVVHVCGAKGLNLTIPKESANAIEFCKSKGYNLKENDKKSLKGSFEFGYELS